MSRVGENMIPLPFHLHVAISMRVVLQRLRHIVAGYSNILSASCRQIHIPFCCNPGANVSGPLANRRTRVRHEHADVRGLPAEVRSDYFQVSNRGYRILRHTDL